jgi:hypothetical protein
MMKDYYRVALVKPGKITVDLIGTPSSDGLIPPYKKLADLPQWMVNKIHVLNVLEISGGHVKGVGRRMGYDVYWIEAEPGDACATTSHKQTGLSAFRPSLALTNHLMKSGEA